ncbi:MAG: 3-phosphoshikimate 1-carboxyvinyltransferase [Candidatus Omnitrophica bacterium]|nr:3-phosphoshikimate 1-carboxyvinyltransferase [Candidatus Omnitrophota bacterium]
MMLVVHPARSLKGEVLLPPSKSYSIRSVIVASCGGRSAISNLSSCDDARRALEVARALGASIKFSNHSSNLVIKANFDLNEDSYLKVNVGESGTVLRFLLPLLALRKSSSLITGEGTLLGRPNKFLTQTLRRMGRNITGQGSKESIPIKINKGIVKGGNISIDGSLSSQFISALLISCPLLKEDTRLKIAGKKIVSAPYITMTIHVLKKAGIKIRERSDAFYLIPGCQTFKGLKNFVVPSDYGLAAFLLAAGALTKSNLTLKGFFDDSLVQADGAILEFLRQMGVRVKKEKKSLKINGPFQLKGGNFSLKNCPDLVPVMVILGLFARGKTRLYDVGHARVKESDRISDLRKELLKVGARIKETKDEIVIYPQEKYKQNVILDPHHDHRLAMAFSVLGLKIGVRVKNGECVAKSYPEFVSDLKRTGVKVKKA